MTMTKLAADLTGMVFGRLTVLLCTGSKNGSRTTWNCKCECGSSTDLPANALKSGNTSSCGCLARDTHRALLIAKNTSHGLSQSKTYSIWSGMQQRCFNKKRSNYKRYGGRGITVCERWRLFENFLSDMGPCPTSQHTLERKENDGNYAPGNCIWATRNQQCRNTRRNISLEIRGETKCITDWAALYGVSPFTVYNRVRNGWDLNETILRKPGGKRKLL